MYQYSRGGVRGEGRADLPYADTQIPRGDESDRASCQRPVAHKGPQDSGSELLQNLREQRLVRIAARHPDPHFANGDFYQRADFEEF